MSKYYLLLLILLTPLLSLSQNDTSKVKSVILASLSFELGGTIDRYPAINLETMYNLTKTPSQLDRNLIGHDMTYDRDVEGSRVGAAVSLIPYDKKENKYSTKREIRVGFSYSVRGTHLSYFLMTQSGAFKSVAYSTRFKELRLSGAYIWKYSPKFAERFTLHGGIGLSVGSTFNDQTSVAEHFSSGQTNEIPNSIFNVYNGKSSLFSRAFIPVGIDFALFEQFDIGVESSFGVAHQKVVDGDSYFIPTNGSLYLRVSYYF